MSPSPSAPDPADLQEAASTFPDGPNVAPSAHEHEAARGQASPAVNAPDAGTTENGPPDRHQRIEEAAYALASQRGFADGRDLDDWLEAERAVDGAGIRSQGP